MNNNSNNKILKIAGICILAGIVLTVLFASTAGNRIYNNGHWNFDEHWNADQNFDNIEREDVYLEFNNKIDKLDITMTVSDLEIRKGDKYSLEVKDSFKDGFRKAEVDGDTLVIKQKEYNFFGIFSMNFNAPVAVLTIPDGASFDDVEIQCGVGDSKISDINSEKIQVTLGTGDATIENLKIERETNIQSGVGKVNVNEITTDKFIIHSGVGDVKCNNVTSNKAELSAGTGSLSVDEADLKDLKLNCGVGDIDIAGKVIGDTDINGGVGKITFDLTGDIDDYYFDSDSGVGKVTVNDKEIDNHLGDDDAPNKFDIDGGVGDISINID